MPTKARSAWRRCSDDVAAGASGAAGAEARGTSPAWDEGIGHAEEAGSGGGHSTHLAPRIPVLTRSVRLLCEHLFHRCADSVKDEGWTSESGR